MLIACGENEEANIPKPKGYYRVTFPAHSYVPFKPIGCPYSFDISTSSEIGRAHV